MKETSSLLSQKDKDDARCTCDDVGGCVAVMLVLGIVFLVTVLVKHSPSETGADTSRLGAPTKMPYDSTDDKDSALVLNRMFADLAVVKYQVELLNEEKGALETRVAELEIESKALRDTVYACVTTFESTVEAEVNVQVGELGERLSASLNASIAQLKSQTTLEYQAVQAQLTTNDGSTRNNSNALQPLNSSSTSTDLKPSQDDGTWTVWKATQFTLVFFGFYFGIVCCVVYVAMQLPEKFWYD